jgi:hypothetical protein
MTHIKLISMNGRLFWMHLEVHEAVQGEVHVHHDPHVLHVQGQKHGVPLNQGKTFFTETLLS